MGHGRLTANATFLEEIRHLRTKIATMEIYQKRAAEEEYVSEIEESSEEEEEEESEEAKVFKVLAKVSGKPIMEIP